jgi:hypothetical protein
MPDRKTAVKAIILVTHEIRGDTVNVVTHACAPVVVALAVDVVRLYSGRNRLFSKKHLIAVGIAGALPDLLNPHLSLRARYSSWTHTLWFVLAIYPALMAICWKWFRQRWLLLANFLWLAIIAHIATDTISNGTRPLYPYGPVISYRLIRGGVRNWIRFDLAFIMAIVVLSIWTAWLERRQISSRSPAP